MKDQHPNKTAGKVYLITWYVMIVSLALMAVLEQLEPEGRIPYVVELLLHLFLASIPISLLVLSVVLFIRKSHTSAVVAVLLSALWLLIRFVAL
jgi:ABC-type antimicrobial peptide transport system permease subunit